MFQGLYTKLVMNQKARALSTQELGLQVTIYQKKENKITSCGSSRSV